MQLPGRRRVGPILGLVTIALVCGAGLVVLLFGRPADSVVLSAASPGYGAYLGAAPASVTLTFTAPVAQAHVQISGAMAGQPAVAGQTVTVPVTGAGAGRHVVDYHVITAAGAEVTGTLPFVVDPSAGGPGVAAPPAASGVAGAAGASGVAAPAVPAPAVPAPGGQPSGLSAAHQHGDVDPVTLVVLAVNVVVVLVLGIRFVRTRPGRGAGAGPPLEGPARD